MEALFTDIDYRDPLWIAVAYACGLLFMQMRLPPMIGFLVAGFVLHALGVQNSDFIGATADLGVTLLLFTIGLKLNIQTIFRREIWLTAFSHMGGSMTFFFALFLVFSAGGILLFSGASMQAAFVLALALSFSSTVFAAKTLEDRGSMRARYGSISIGILVMQDIAAVVFLVVSAGKVPSIWALALILLIPARYLIGRLMQVSGHGELLTIFGFVAALSGAALFELVGLKGDLGALVFGAMLAPFAKSSELARTLMGFKELFLVCFFLSIGLTGLPTLASIATALLILLFLPLKTALYYWLMTRLKVRARGATLASLALSNYSEFGLIVMVVAVEAGLLGEDWITIMALAVSVSFFVAAPLNSLADDIYSRYRHFLRRFENDARLHGDEDIHLDNVRVLVFGMGRVGLGAYDEMREVVGDAIVGIDQDQNEVERLAETGRRVVLGDATNPEFWSRIERGREIHQTTEGVELVLLAMPLHASNQHAAEHLRTRGYKGAIVATAKYRDEVESLKESGVDAVHNIYAEAGSATARHSQPFLQIDLKN